MVVVPADEQEPTPSPFPPLALAAGDIGKPFWPAKGGAAPSAIAEALLAQWAEPQVRTPSPPPPADRAPEPVNDLLAEANALMARIRQRYAGERADSVVSVT